MAARKAALLFQQPTLIWRRQCTICWCIRVNLRTGSTRRVPLEYTLHDVMWVCVFAIVTGATSLFLGYSKLTLRRSNSP